LKYSGTPAVFKAIDIRSPFFRHPNDTTLRRCFITEVLEAESGMNFWILQESWRRVLSSGFSNLSANWQMPNVSKGAGSER